jgi:hypothetical protein
MDHRDVFHITIGNTSFTLASVMLFGMPGAIVGGLVGDMAISSKIGKGIQFIHDLDRVHHRLNRGGNYEDTQDAWTMRPQASREMAGSLRNARQWLGKEGAFLHA